VHAAEVVAVAAYVIVALLALVAWRAGRPRLALAVLIVLASRIVSRA
jgi:uncharacterized membrane protein